MKEDFLHFVWQFQQFAREQLQTVQGQQLTVLKTGEHNFNAGPDFLQAQLKIDEVLWAGSVEIHIRSSDWDRHHHAQDAKYDSVVLHVVWENDRPVKRSDGSLIPTLELKDRIAAHQLSNYEALVLPKPGIPCSLFFAGVPELTRWSMLDRTLHERLNQKAAVIQEILEELKGDWEETAYRWLFRAFGFKINAEGFIRLSQALPLKVVRRHQDNFFQLEALLLGQAGFLTNPSDEYTSHLKEEFTYLSHKYQLAEYTLELKDWNFLRLRPANFPTLRLAQLAATLFQFPHLSSALLCPRSAKEWEGLFRREPSAYWRTHYRPGHPASERNAAMGLASVQNLLINTVAPFLVCYANQKGETSYLESALCILESIPGERNHITELYRSLGQPLKTAADSQAMLQLNVNYCVPVNCLACSIGVKILGEKHG